MSNANDVEEICFDYYTREMFNRLYGFLTKKSGSADGFKSWNNITAEMIIKKIGSNHSLIRDEKNNMTSIRIGWSKNNLIDLTFLLLNDIKGEGNPEDYYSEFVEKEKQVNREEGGIRA